MTLYRVKHNRENPYVVVNRSITTDNRLSWKAKGIWLYAFSRPDDWSFYLKDLMNQSKDSRDSVRSGLKELEKYGYLRRDQERQENGQYKEGNWTFYETPQIPDSGEKIQKSLPKTDFPSSEKESSANRPLQSNESRLSNERTTTTKLDPPPRDPPAKSKDKSSSSSCLDKLKINASMKRKLSKEHPQDKLEKAVDRTLKWERRSNDEVGITTVLQNWDTWADKPETSTEDDNRAYLEKLRYLDMHQLKIDRVTVGPDYIEFINTGVEGFCHFSVRDPKFIKKVQERLKTQGHEPPS